LTPPLHRPQPPQRPGQPYLMPQDLTNDPLDVISRCMDEADRIGELMELLHHTYETAPHGAVRGGQEWLALYLQDQTRLLSRAIATAYGALARSKGRGH